MTTLEIIRSIENKKKEANKHPFHALVTEVKEISEAAFNELEILEDQNVIYTGQTINNIYIHIL